MAHIGRLSTMGEMVSGLAHELNQPLSAIANFARASLYRVRSMAGDELDEVAESLEQIAGQADRAGAIIRHLRGFVRRADAERTDVDVNQLVREISVLLEVDARLHEARLALVLDESLPTLIGDRVQLEQVIANLVRNALEAMNETPPAKREVTIATAGLPNGGVEVAVRDRGSGCRNGDADRWFDPFYTTKPSGMGLGLSISRSIVESHGGRLDALPNPEGGSIFRFRLPLRAEGNET
jgi:C4-dicarboxylate-specific signal transduction histidine kinase